MTDAEKFIAEIRQEAATTRKVLGRVPEDRFSWKPHAKSMSLGQLAMHIAELPGAIAVLLKDPVTEVPNVPLTEPKSVAELLWTLERSIESATERLAAWGDEGLSAIWTLTASGRTLLTMPRVAFVRSVMMNHVYHHRGQLTVYLRMLDVPLPSVYGPTADESPFG